MNTELRAWAKLEDWTYVMLDNEALWNFTLSELQAEHNGYTIMRSIWYRDINWDMIFEWDIVANEAGYSWEVYFDEKELQWRMRAENGSTQAFSWYIGNDYHTLSIIGNKYLNS